MAGLICGDLRSSQIVAMAHETHSPQFGSQGRAFQLGEGGCTCVQLGGVGCTLQLGGGSCKCVQLCHYQEGCDQGNEPAVTGEIWPHITIAITPTAITIPISTAVLPFPAVICLITLASGAPVTSGHQLTLTTLGRTALSHRWQKKTVMVSN